LEPGASPLSAPPPAPKKPRPKESLIAPRSSQAVPAQGLLSLEDTISAATALAVLRGEAVILHIETTGPDPLRDEVLAIHARRVRKHRTIAEISLRVLPLRALPAATAEDRLGSEAGRPPAKSQGVPLQEAVSHLQEFLGTHRQHVFVHGSAGTQAFLGQAARQYDMVIENPVGDVVDLARLAWPGRAEYSLSGLARDLLPELGAILTTADATKAIQGLLQAASKVLAGSGGLVSKSIVHWGTSPDTIRLKPSPW
jgi:DNA polymerase III alpha subunit (gram-positive type)